jgi:2'-5' RNA ligase
MPGAGRTRRHRKGLTVIRYVQDTSGWEEWQREYRLGLILILPPADVGAQVDALRREHDPRSASICGAHISLSEPLTKEFSPEVEREVRAALSAVEPFEIHYGPLRTFDPHPGVAYRIEPADRFFELREVLHSTSAFVGSSLKRRDVPPHMTIAEFLPDMAASEELRDRLEGKVPEGSFLCDRLSLMVPDEGFRFRRVLDLELGAAGPSR